MSQATFPQDECWKVLEAMLAEQLTGVDVQPVSEKDFEGDNLILNPPAVRIFYVGAPFAATSDSQRLSYDVTSRFIVLCGDQDLTSVIAQAHASAHLADQVAGILAGARINLPSGDQSMPITLLSIDPLPVDGLGMAYAVAVEVPGLAQFPGTNAAGFTPAGGGE